MPSQGPAPPCRHRMGCAAAIRRVLSGRLQNRCRSACQSCKSSRMDDFVAHTSRRRIALLIAGSLGFVAIGVWMAGLFGPIPALRQMSPMVAEFWGWCAILFFGMCALAGAKLWWANSERLRIGRSGIRWSGWSDQTIPWDEIAAVTEWRYRNTRSIILHLRDPSLYPGRGFAAFSARANRALTGGDIGISLTGTDRKFADAIAAIARFRPIG